MLESLLENVGGREAYEDMRSPNQDLTFETTEKEFLKRNVPFDMDLFQTLKIVNSDGFYSNLGLLLSDQCAHTIKAAVFEGTTKAVFRNRRYFVNVESKMTEIASQSSN